MFGLSKTPIAEKTVENDKIGTIKYAKRKGLKHLSIAVKSALGVNVSVPYSVSYKEAERFVAEKSDWIVKSQQKLSKRQPTLFDSNTVFSTKYYKLRIFPHRDNTVRRVFTEDGFLNIYYPESADLKSPKLQQIFQNFIVDALYVEASKYLPKRLDFLARKFGFKYKNLRIKNNTSNLGSCSYQNNINLNLHIMRLSDELIDYVILHELCHTVEKNHGDGFWSLLDSVTNNKARELSKQAKKINTKFV